MITSTFISKAGSYTDEFHRLNNEIDEIAAANLGYLGRKRWTDSEGVVAVVYYWNSMQDLRLFQANEVHSYAKSRYAEWYEGYRIEIAEIQQVYGDGYFDNQFPAPK